MLRVGERMGAVRAADSVVGKVHVASGERGG